jgi:hypothetical protein
MSEPEKITPMTFTGHTWTEEHRPLTIKATAGDGRLPVEPKITRCEQCGHVQSLIYEYRGGPLGSVTPVMPTGTYLVVENGVNITYPDYPVCQCPRTEPTPGHDGKIEIIREGERDFVIRATGHGTWFLTPEKCLDLLAELDEFRETFERLAKEQPDA